jgi:predicted nucleic acid-binding protein
MRVVPDTNVLLGVLISPHGSPDAIYRAGRPGASAGRRRGDRSERHLPIGDGLGGEADYLVTGDRRAGLLQHGSIGRARIVTPAIFCAEAL